MVALPADRSGQSFFHQRLDFGIEDTNYGQSSTTFQSRRSVKLSYFLDPTREREREIR